MFQQWKRKGVLKPRLSAMLGIEGFRKFRRDDFSTQTDQNQLRLGGVKIIIHETTGQLNPSQEELNEMVLRIHESGMQVILHAVEKETIEAACDAIEFALKRSPRQDHRHRIEHCSVCTPFLSKRIASLGIFVVTQPSFIYYSGERYLSTVPDCELKHLYPIATLMKSGARVAGSSDCPIVPPNPLKGIYSAVSRLAKSGELIPPAEEKIALPEALRMYTDDAARTTFEEMVKGSITPNKVADLVILNRDPSNLPLDEIKDIEVEMTILNGEIVWEKRA
jgi:predicted amidohydrolase YtcJ